MTDSAPRVALVTGGAGAIGRAIAARLARDGVLVIQADMRTDDLPGGLALDVTDEQSVAAAYAAIAVRHGRLDILVNNAGILRPTGHTGAGVADTPLAAWDETLRVNLAGTFLMCRGAIAPMRRTGGGQIVNLASRAARMRNDGAPAAYAASKAAIIGLSRVLAGELGVDGITVNCVAPSSVETAMTRPAAVEDAGYFGRRASETVLGRIGTPGDVAEVVAFLCSKDAAFLTGTVLDVTGGSFMP